MNALALKATLRIEEASLNAWPALQQQLFDGWILRFSRGFTKRANAIVPLYPSGSLASTSPTVHEANLAARVRYCENLYAREGLQTVFRLTSINPYPELEPYLAARGYQRVDLTQVQVADLRAQPTLASESSATKISFVDREPWLAAYGSLTDLPAGAQLLHGTLLKSIPGIAGYAILQRIDDGEPLACGLAVVEGELVGLFDIITAPNARRQGHGYRLVQNLLDWGQQQGAESAYLQVVADNANAIALYQKLGFQPAYHYWYRVN